MKTLVSADYHIGVTSFGVIDSNGKNSRLIDVERVLNKIVDFAIAQKIDLFFQCGDIFHTNRPTQEEQLIFLRFINRLMGCDFISRFIIGNHDWSSKLGVEHALKLFQSLLDGQDKVKIYDKTTWEVFEKDNERFLVSFYPYKGDEPVWSEMMDGTHGAYTRSAVVCHSHLEGAIVGAEPFEIKSDNVTRFNQLPVDFVFAGHFHKPQQLCEKPIAFYPGSIQAVDFNERFDVKGAVLVDVINRYLEPVGFDTRRLIQFDCKTVDEINKIDFVACKDAIVKVNIEFNQIDIVFDEDELRKKIVAAGCHSIAGINVKYYKIEKTRNADVKIDNDVLTNFNSFTLNLDLGENKAKIIESGKELIKDACASN